MPRIRHIANLWTLDAHPPGRREWDIEKKFSAIQASGFHGITALLDPAKGRLAEKHGLCAIGYFASAQPREFRRLILQNRDAGALRINVQLGDHDTPGEKALAMTLRLLEEADKIGIPCDIEVHRDTCTETPEKTYALAAAYARSTGQILPMTWDFSHLAVVKHLAPPYWERLIINPRLIQHARQFHFRPFNGHHCQVPVTDGKGKLSIELRQWLPFLDKVVETILDGPAHDEDIYVCPEMGPIPGGYNFAQLPHSWDDAQILRPLIAKSWKKALSHHPSGTSPAQ